VALPACTATVWQRHGCVSARQQLYVVQCGVTAAIDTKTQTIVAQIPARQATAWRLAQRAASSIGRVARWMWWTRHKRGDWVMPITATSIAFSPDAHGLRMSEQNNVSAWWWSTPRRWRSRLRPEHQPYGGGYSQGESIAVTADGKFVYAGANPGAVINAKTLAVVGQFDAGGRSSPIKGDETYRGSIHSKENTWHET